MLHLLDLDAIMGCIESLSPWRSEYVMLLWTVNIGKDDAHRRIIWISLGLDLC